MGLHCCHFSPPYIAKPVLAYYKELRERQGATVSDPGLDALIQAQELSLECKDTICSERDVQRVPKEIDRSDLHGILPILPQASSQFSPVEIWHANPQSCLISSFNQAFPLSQATDRDAIACYENLVKADKLCREIFKVASVLTQTGTLLGCVHSPTTMNDAAWHPKEERFLFGDSDPRFYNSFSQNFSVAAHEVGHAVTQYASSLLYEGQTGALNESCSDVFAAILMQYEAEASATSDSASWLIGEGLLANTSPGTALRSLKAPGTAYTNHPLLHISDPQPSHMDHYVEMERDNDHGGVHYNSGIPNKAFYVAATTIGGPTWETVGQIWFEAMRTANSDESFAEFSRRTIDVSKSLGYSDGVTNCIGQAWSGVGVKWRGSGDQPAVRPTGGGGEPQGANLPIPPKSPFWTSRKIFLLGAAGALLAGGAWWYTHEKGVTRLKV